ncbi:unknown [Euproctis pseudoconspersa nucleopolyhedrovirus]|uniref:Uncharacterized protein n=1 Tax=Euproctis pseudoconspersa nucleopolyhedrovirus TaxID=307467 RepID=C3TWU2_9ABAC|nr:hypothetical protein EupsNPV_gp034 [Euproctis pseudoconspersa nucleopolyhedrovirus]ACO53484.1 unknown [Euproctis pseudoconspersa nucleopolyhedrovirus]
MLQASIHRSCSTKLAEPTSSFICEMLAGSPVRSRKRSTFNLRLYISSFEMFEMFESNKIN